MLGVKIDRNLNVASLISLVISAVTAIYLAYQHLIGPVIEFFPPRWMVVWAERYGEAGLIFNVGAELAYSNTANPGYNAAIYAEFVKVRFKGNIYYFEGISRATIDNPRSPPECSRNLVHEVGASIETEDGTRVFGCYSGEAKLRFRETQPLERTLIGASSTSHETVFAPARCERFRLKCENGLKFLKWNRFLARIGPGEVINFKIGVVLVNRSKVTTNCRITISQVDIIFLQDRSWNYFDDCSSGRRG